MPCRFGIDEYFDGMIVTATELAHDSERVLDQVIQRGEIAQIQRNGKTVAEIHPKVGVSREEALRILGPIRWTEAESQELKHAMNGNERRAFQRSSRPWELIRGFRLKQTTSLCRVRPVEGLRAALETPGLAAPDNREDELAVLRDPISQRLVARRIRKEFGALRRNQHFQAFRKVPLRQAIALQRARDSRQVQ